MGKPLDRTERQEDSVAAAEATTPAHAHLRLVFGRPQNAVFRVEEGGIILGRNAQETVPHAVLDDNRTSRSHAKIERLGAHWQMTDLGSRNAGYVEGQRFESGESVPLVDGSIVRLGDSILVFRTEPPATGDEDAAVYPGVSPEALRVRRRLEALRSTVGHVLVLGETGTGKERVARSLVRDGGTVVAVNCAELSRELGRADLFGHARGAFSGAASAREGLIDRAQGGTLFFDELGELPLETQADLLRFLEDGTYRPLGTTEVRTSHARVVGATNVLLDDAVHTGRFRRDLLARMRASNTPLELAPLRERREDILPWVEQFFRETQPQDKDVHLAMNAGMAECLLLYPWPENLRELRGVVRGIANTPPPYTPSHLPARIREHRIRMRTPTSAQTLLSQRVTSSAAAETREPSKEEVQNALEQQRGRVRAAAEMLGIERRKLYRLCERLGINIEAYRETTPT